MKLFSYYFVSLLVLLPSLLAFQAHNQSLPYTHPAIVVSGDVSYISVQDVPEGTTITSTTYWTPLLSTAPSTEPGDPPAAEPSDDDIGNLPTPIEPDNAIILKGISTNAIVTSDAWMVAGVTISGGTKKVVFQVQASGTYGTNLGYLADPILYITNSAGTVVAIVDNWKDGPNAGYDSTLYNSSYLSELESSVYAMAGDEECAIVLNLPEGSYTALVGSNGESSGKAVVAAFDFETGDSLSKLKGISTNAIVTSDAWMVAGVTISGGTKKVVFQVQASGTYGTNLGYLADPILYITNSAGTVVAIVDNWKDGPNAGYDANLYSTSYLSELESSVYAMAGDEECAIVLNLPEGSYTALVGSNGESSGKAVVAAFDFEE